VFLDLYKKAGWKTFGVEPSQSSQIATKKGHTVLKSSFEETHFGASTFDLIIANHVLEHVVDPILFLKKAHKLLKNGGILFIDVPNAGSFSQSILKDKWPYFLPDEHLSHFTKETLIFTLSKAGFTPVFSKTKSGMFEVSNPIKYLFTELISLKKNFFIDLWRIPENLISEVLDKGNSISIISKKHA
jgi:SAM-dependent methyltransferase